MNSGVAVLVLKVFLDSFFHLWQYYLLIECLSTLIIFWVSQGWDWRWVVLICWCEAYWIGTSWTKVLKTFVAMFWDPSTKPNTFNFFFVVLNAILYYVIILACHTTITVFSGVSWMKLDTQLLSLVCCCCCILQ